MSLKIDTCYFVLDDIKESNNSGKKYPGVHWPSSAVSLFFSYFNAFQTVDIQKEDNIVPGCVLSFPVAQNEVNQQQQGVLLVV